MYLFSITINVEEEITENWMEWLRTELKVVLQNKSLVQDFRVLKILSEELGNGNSYSFQFHLPKEESIPEFIDFYDNNIGIQMLRKYKGKFVEFRMPLKVLDWKF